MNVGETIVYRVGRIVCWVTVFSCPPGIVFDSNGNIYPNEVPPKCGVVLKRRKLKGRG